MQGKAADAQLISSQSSLTDMAECSGDASHVAAAEKGPQKRARRTRLRFSLHPRSVAIVAKVKPISLKPCRNCASRGIVRANSVCRNKVGELCQSGFRCLFRLLVRPYIRLVMPMRSRNGLRKKLSHRICFKVYGNREHPCTFDT
jgi:hypothetical protein